MLFRSNELAAELSNKIEALNKAINSQEKAELAYKVATARDELFQWNQRLSAPLGNTCEQIAEDSRIEYITSRLIVDEEGKRVWDKFEDYLTEKEQSLAQQARFQVMLYLQGLESDFLEHTPEAMAMKELEEEASLQIMKDIAAMAAEEPIVDKENLNEVPQEETKKPVKKINKKD